MRISIDTTKLVDTVKDLLVNSVPTPPHNNESFVYITLHNPQKAETALFPERQEATVLWPNLWRVSESTSEDALTLSTAPLAKLAQGESVGPANLVRTAWVQFLPPPARSMLRAFHQAVCLPLLRFQ
jgi:hypothetical protein